MPAKGADYILPGQCCVRVKPRVPTRTRGCDAVNAKTRIRGVCWIRAFVRVASGRRAVALGGDMPAGRQAVVHPGPGWTNEDRRYQLLPLAAGLLGDGKRRRADTRSALRRRC